MHLKEALEKIRSRGFSAKFTTPTKKNTPGIKCIITDKKSSNYEGQGLTPEEALEEAFPFHINIFPEDKEE